MENGAIKRTTCCEFFGPLRRGMRSGSKSGGKYLFKTAIHSAVNEQVSVARKELYGPLRSAMVVVLVRVTLAHVAVYLP